MNNKKINLFSKSYIIWLGLLLSFATAFAITVNTIDTQWAETDFEVWDQITQNMLLAQTRGYTCNNSDCSEKVYWKTDGNQKYFHEAIDYCKSIWMDLAWAADQAWVAKKALPWYEWSVYISDITTYSKYYNFNHWVNGRYYTSNSIYTLAPIQNLNDTTSTTADPDWTIQYYLCVY